MSTKAFLLAAGKGTRLRPLTDTVPKCLVPINGVPLLEIWIRQLEAAGISEVLINTHHLSDQVETFVSRMARETTLSLATVHEATLLGSGGTVWHNRDFVADADAFFVVYADNLTPLRLADMAAAHKQYRRRGGLLTMGLFHAANPSACGIAQLDSCGKILSFIEKPLHPTGDLANGGIYVADRSIFDHFPVPPGDGGVLDFGHHVLPRLVGNLYGYEIGCYFRDIGTPESYQAAQQEWPAER